MPDRNSIIDKIKALLAKTTENGATEAEMLAALDHTRAADEHERPTAADTQRPDSDFARGHPERRLADRAQQRRVRGVGLVLQRR